MGSIIMCQRFYRDIFFLFYQSFKWTVTFSEPFPKFGFTVPENVIHQHELFGKLFFSTKNLAKSGEFSYLVIISLIRMYVTHIYHPIAIVRSFAVGNGLPTYRDNTTVLECINCQFNVHVRIVLILVRFKTIESRPSVRVASVHLPQH